VPLRLASKPHGLARAGLLAAVATLFYVFMLPPDCWPTAASVAVLAVWRIDLRRRVPGVGS